MTHEERQDEQLNTMVAELSLAERLDGIRQARGYIQREKIENVGHTAVTHEHLMALVRPLFIEWGVRWKPVAVEVLSDEIIRTTKRDGSDQIAFTALMKWTFRFKRTEDPDGEGNEGPAHYEDVVVVSRGLDRQAKDAGGSQTYAEKYALMAVMNLGRGDDPDLTPVDLSPDVPADIEERIRKIRGILDADPAVDDTDSALRGIAAGWGEHYGRKVGNIYSLSVQALDQTIRQLERKGKDVKVEKKPKPNPDPPDVDDGIPF